MENLIIETSGDDSKNVPIMPNRPLKAVGGREYLPGIAIGVTVESALSLIRAGYATGYVHNQGAADKWQAAMEDVGEDGRAGIDPEKHFGGPYLAEKNGDVAILTPKSKGEFRGAANENLTPSETSRLDDERAANLKANRQARVLSTGQVAGDVRNVATVEAEKTAATEAAPVSAGADALSAPVVIDPVGDVPAVVDGSGVVDGADATTPETNATTSTRKRGGNSPR